MIYKAAEKKDRYSPVTLGLGLVALADQIDVANNKTILLERHIEELYATVDAQRDCIAMLRKNVVDLGRVLTQEKGAN